MPSFNFTFQEASPLIIYTGLWMEGSKHNDTRWADYDGSFRVTNSTGAKATLDFNGTGATLFGGFRGNHGDYVVDLDHGTQDNANGNEPDLFKQVLWQQYGLSYGPHTVEATNQPSSSGPYFDLDFVQIERAIGQDNDTVFLSMVDDTSPFIQYKGNWEPSSTMESMNHNGTIHQTTESDSELEITFQGCCIELYGLYTNAAYTVALDGGPPKAMQGMDIDLDTEFWHPQTLLYLVDGLREDQNHTVTLIATQTTEKRPLAFDYSIVRSTHNFTSDSSPFALAESSTSSKNVPVSHIVGGAIGGVVSLALIIAVLFFLRRWKIRRASAQTDAMAQMGTESSTQAHHNWTSRGQNGHILRPSSMISPWHPPSGDDATYTEELLSSQQGSTGASATRSSPSAPRRHGGKHRMDIVNPSSVPSTQQSIGNSNPSVRRRTDTGAGTTGTNSVTYSQNPTNPSLVSHESSRPVSTPALQSAPNTQPSNDALASQAREEDAGHLYRDGPLPPAYNPAWDQN